MASTVVRKIFTTASGGSGSSITLVAGTNITIDNTDPTQPIISTTADDITIVANYSALPAANTVSGKFYWCSASQGTSWLPGSLGGTYYSAGLYYSNGTTWEFIDVPYQATQATVDTGTNTNQFVTPSTFTNASKWANYGLLANPLSQFAATTSAQLASVISDETGSGALVFGTTPTFTTNITTPKIIGGTGIGSSLDIQSTSGVGSSDYIRFLVGNNGATEAARFLTGGALLINRTTATSAAGKVELSTGNNAYGYTHTNGTIILTTYVDVSTASYLGTATNHALDLFVNNGATRLRVQAGGNIGIGSKLYISNVASTPTALLHLGAGSSSANSAPVKLTTGTPNTTAEAGALEYNTPQLLFTNGGGQRQEIPLIQQTRVSTQLDVTSSTSVVQVTGLTSTLVAGKIYKFEVKLFVDASGGGTRVSFGGTATATTFINQYNILDNATSGVLPSRTTALTTEVTNNPLTSGFITMEGTIVVNGAGTFYPTFAQKTSNGTASSVLVGSSFIVMETA